jgi:hypothetical protein
MPHPSTTALSPRVHALGKLLAHQHQLNTTQPLPQHQLKQTLNQLEATLQQQVQHISQASQSWLGQGSQAAIPSTEAGIKAHLLGTNEPSGWLMHLLAWQYLPAAVLTPLVTKATLAQRPDINSPANQREQTRAEVWRQVTSGSIHVALAYGSGLAYKGLMALTHQHHKLTHWGLQAKGIPLVGAGLQATGQCLKQWGQHLGGASQQTAGTLAFMILGSTLGYGVLRPYVSMSAYTHDKERELHALPNTPQAATFQDATITLTA